MKLKLLFAFLLLSIVNAFAIQDTVKVGAYVINIHDINFHDKEYTIRYWLWMRYTNPALNFNNTVEVPNAKEIEQPDFFTDTSHKVKWQLMKMKCIMNQSWKVENFPFDKQNLRVSMENSKYDSERLHFELDDRGAHFDPSIAVDGWSIKDFKITTGKREYLTDFGEDDHMNATFYDTFNISLRLERNAWGLFMKLFIGMYIAFLIAAVSFLIDPEHVEPRFGLPVGGLFAAVGNKYIIDSLLPESNVFTLVDWLHSLTFFTIFLIITQASVALICEKKGLHLWMHRIQVQGAYLIMGFYLISNLVLITLALL